MTREELFAAIGMVEESRLQRSELTVSPEETGTNMRKNRRIFRNFLIAAIIASMLAVTAYAVAGYLIFESPEDMITTIFGDKTGFDHSEGSIQPDPNGPPSGIIVECQEERSQFKNRDKAMKMLKTKLYDMKMTEQNEKIASDRKSQVGTGDRSERIRTYNYPQGRVSEHRIGLTIYHLEQTLNGDLDEIIDALITADQAEKLKAEAN